MCALWRLMVRLRSLPTVNSWLWLTRDAPFFSRLLPLKNLWSTSGHSSRFHQWSNSIYYWNSLRTPLKMTNSSASPILLEIFVRIIRRFRMHCIGAGQGKDRGRLGRDNSTSCCRKVFISSSSFPFLQTSIPGLADCWNGQTLWMLLASRNILKPEKVMKL